MKQKVYVSMLLSAVLIIQACNSEKKSNDVAHSDSTANRAGAQTASAEPTTASSNALKPEEFVQYASAWWAMVKESAKIAQTNGEHKFVEIFANQMMQDDKAFKDAFVELEKNSKIPVSTKATPQDEKLLEELRKTPGKEFDGKYMKIMVERYKQAADIFEAATSSSDTAVKAFAQKMRKSVDNNHALAIDVEYNSKI